MLVHHGLFWDFHPTGLTPVLAERLRPLFKHDVALAAYHLPLDAHPEVGNNAILAERLGLRAPRAVRRRITGRPIGRAGTFPGDGDRRPPSCSRACARSPRRVPTVFDGGPGARPPHRDRLGRRRRRRSTRRSRAGLDAFLTGEPREHVMADAREAGIHFIAAGHYATETFGVPRAGRLAGRSGSASSTSGSTSRTRSDGRSSSSRPNV